MRRFLPALAAVVFAALVTTAGLPAAQVPAHPVAVRVKALVGGTLIDGYGGPPLRNSVVIIEGERVKAVGQVGVLAVPTAAEVISTEGMSVLPGLWDAHVHLDIDGHADYDHWDRAYAAIQEEVIKPASAKQLLMAGVTSARDLGANLGEILVGTVSPGKYADIVAVRGDVLRHIALLQSVNVVIHRGARVK